MLVLLILVLLNSLWCWELHCSGNLFLNLGSYLILGCLSDSAVSRELFMLVDSSTLGSGSSLSADVHVVIVSS
jgi:hypothetical protein